MKITRFYSTTSE